MNTAISQMMDDIVKNGKNNIDYAKYLQLERDQIQAAVIYGLDEDGHTGTWKLSVAQNYYNEKHLEITGLPGGDK
jgi:hypothetical protein